MNQTILELQNISKEYPGVKALDGVSLSFRRGEVHALVGENGAGKSTLIKTISGAETPDAGTIVLNGEIHSKMTPSLAMGLGIQVIYQEFNLVTSLSAAENICLGSRYGRMVNYRYMNEIARGIFERFAVQIDPTALVRELSTSQQQIVEIAKAVSRKAEILIMDEPTAPLTMAEVGHLFAIIRQLKAEGVTILYISHRLDEIFELADRVSVLRDGTYIATRDTRDTSRHELIQLMVGRELSDSYPERGSNSGPPVLELKGLSGNGDRDISFAIHKGEILGLSGLVGAGRTELAKMLYGAVRIEGGALLLHGTPQKPRSPRQAMQMGIGLIPEDRKTEGCFLEQSVQWNISIASIRNVSKGLFVSPPKEKRQADEYCELLNIKTPTLEQRVRNLSGGNQQKVALAKTLATHSDIIIFDEPTRGIDVGAKQEIYQLMNDLTHQGRSILMITSDMEELLGMADRVVVLCEGRLAGIVEKADFSQEHILDLASGGGIAG